MTMNSKLVHALCEEIERPSYVTWTLFLFFLISRAKAVGIQREAVHGATAPNGAKVAALRNLFLHARLYSASVQVAISLANTDRVFIFPFL